MPEEEVKTSEVDDKEKEDNSQAENNLPEVSSSFDPAAWTKNPEAVEAITVARRLRKTKHGIYAQVPIICKAEACPYSHSCPLLEQGMAPYAEKCPLEIAAIEDLFERYASHFDIDLDKNDPGDTVDLMMVKDLVDADIGLLRCDNKMAWDADYVINNTVGFTEDGEALTRQELHPLTDYREKLINRKHKTFQLLNSTRKDKEGSKIIHEIDPSQQASEMLQVIQQTKELNAIEEEREKSYYRNKNDNNIIDVEPVDFEEED